MLTITLASNAIPLNLIPPVVVGLVTGLFLLAISRRASEGRAALADSHAGSVIFTVMPYPQFREQVDAVRHAVNASEPMPKYTRPSAVIDRQTVSFFMTGSESSRFLSIPTSAVAAARAGQTKLAIGKLRTLSLDIIVNGECVALDIPVANPSDATAVASQKFVDELVGQVQLLLVPGT